MEASNQTDSNTARNLLPLVRQESHHGTSSQPSFPVTTPSSQSNQASYDGRDTSTSQVSLSQPSQQVIPTGPAIDGANGPAGNTSLELLVTHTSSNQGTSIDVSGNRPTGKFIRQYVLPDGSVAENGKGLGKGRPGIKRGPRSTKSAGEQMTESPASPVTPSGPIVNKRKRTDSMASNIHATSVTSSQSRESTPEYNPASSQTRSGRQTQRPVSVIAATANPSSPVSKRVNSTSATSTPNLKSHPKIKRRLYKGKEQFALCEHCLRSFGPSTNVIVFCDACNKCWHQRCHNPPISKAVIADTNAEWFCASCDKILHGNKKAKKTTATVKPEIQSGPLPPLPVQQYGLPIVGAVALALDQQKAYLNTLNKDKLIHIILKAGSLAPQLPMFETPLKSPIPSMQQPLPQFASNYTTPVDVGMTDATKSSAQEAPDEGYDDRYDEHAALYPKAGEGIQLPPDRTDLHMLLEGPDSKTFSHWMRGMNPKNYLDNVTLVQG